MSNKFYDLLCGRIDEPEVLINLKQVIPVCIAYPELVIPYGYSLSDIAKFYDSTIDYDTSEEKIIVSEGLDPRTLVSIFTKIFSLVVGHSNSGVSQVESFPKVSLNVDIATTALGFQTIEPSSLHVREFAKSKSAMYTYRGYSSTVKEDLSEAQRHNILLIDMLTRRYNDSGLGGKS